MEIMEIMEILALPSEILTRRLRGTTARGDADAVSCSSWPVTVRSADTRFLPLNGPCVSTLLLPPRIPPSSLRPRDSKSSSCVFIGVAWCEGRGCLHGVLGPSGRPGKGCAPGTDFLCSSKHCNTEHGKGPAGAEGGPRLEGQLGRPAVIEDLGQRHFSS